MLLRATTFTTTLSRASFIQILDLTVMPSLSPTVLLWKPHVLTPSFLTTWIKAETHSLTNVYPMPTTWCTERTEPILDHRFSDCCIRQTRCRQFSTLIQQAYGYLITVRRKACFYIVWCVKEETHDSLFFHSPLSLLCLLFYHLDLDGHPILLVRNPFQQRGDRIIIFNGSSSRQAISPFACLFIYLVSLTYIIARQKVKERAHKKVREQSPPTQGKGMELSR